MRVQKESGIEEEKGISSCYNACSVGVTSVEPRLHLYDQNGIAGQTKKWPLKNQYQTNRKLK